MGLDPHRFGLPGRNAEMGAMDVVSERPLPPRSTDRLERCAGRLLHLRNTPDVAGASLRPQEGGPSLLGLQQLFCRQGTGLICL